jgi:hypothetical protein
MQAQSLRIDFEKEKIISEKVNRTKADKRQLFLAMVQNNKSAD